MLEARGFVHGKRCIAGLGTAAAPCLEAVCAGLDGLVEHNFVAVGCKGVAALGVRVHNVAVGVDHVESHVVYFIGEGVGKLHVPVVGESHPQLGVAIALVVEDEAVAARRQARCGGKGYEQSYGL